VQADGIGTAAGPPARATTLELMAGRAATVTAMAAVKSRLVVVVVRIVTFWRGWEVCNDMMVMIRSGLMEVLEP